MTHVLACALCGSNPQSGTSWLWVIGAFFAFSIILMIAGAHDTKRRKAGLPPREPATDMSPFTASLLSGQNVAAYTAPVRAVTPSGIAVRHGRCCARGHQSPAQAVAHAAQVAQRIAVTGR